MDFRGESARSIFVKNRVLGCALHDHRGDGDGDGDGEDDGDDDTTAPVTPLPN